MNVGYLIEKNLQRIGQTAYFIDDDWISRPFKAYKESLWKRRYSRLDFNEHPMGKDECERFILFCPKSHNVFSLSNNACLKIGNEKFELKQKNAVYFNDDIAYYTVIIERFRE